MRGGARNTVVIRVVDWGGGGGIWRRIELRRSVPLEPYRELLPEPVVADHPEWIELYWAAWQMAFDKISFGTVDNGLADAFMDEGFNEQIYQWDSSFIARVKNSATRPFESRSRGVPKFSVIVGYAIVSNSSAMLSYCAVVKPPAGFDVSAMMIA